MSTEHYIIERCQNEDIILHPKSYHKRTIIFLHGLGDTAEGYLDMFTDPKLCPVCPNTKVVLPTAKLRKVTVNMGIV